ncbi:MAG: hypothetical protein VKS61_07205 [Candidatus Sericytochromatia bacterium]|nr:hypothetical protein [Candidatus Sericytochromatia bacterium]
MARPHPRQAFLCFLLVTQVACSPGATPTAPGATRPRPAGAPQASPPTGVAPNTAASPPGEPPAGATSPSPPAPVAPSPFPSVGTKPATLATLTGVVRAPVRLISDMGGSIVANNGGGLIGDAGGSLISDRGSGYRLRQASAEPEALVANVEVAVLDATGAVVKTADGRELRTRTDAEGRYAFTEPLPAHHVVVQAGRSAQQAALTRIIASGVREADLSVPTTLVAGYVLERFVRPQQDPQATLNRLPAPIEAETVAITASAAANLGAVTLTQAAVAASVEALRRQDAKLDGQLEVVKKLLIVAGLSNLGEGLPGREVTLPDVRHVLEAPDGTLVINAFGDQRLWRLETDGTARTLAGRKPDAAAGQDVGAVDRLTLTPDGRLLALERPAGGPERLWRIGLDGTLERLEPGVPDLLAALALDGGKFWLLSGRYGQAGKTWTWEPGKPAQPGPDLPSNASTGVTIRAIVRLPDGKVRYGGLDWSPVPAVWELDPATGQSTKLTAFPNGGRWPWMDATGRLFYSDASNQTREHLGAGAAEDPRRPDVPSLVPFTMGRDGSVLIARDGRVVRVKDGVETHLAGKRPSATYQYGNAVPMGYGFLPDGQLVLAADGALTRRKLGEEPVELAKLGPVPDPKGGAAFTIDGVIVLPDGTVVLRGIRVFQSYKGDEDCDALLKLGPGGTVQPFYRAAANIAGMRITPRGELLVVEQRHEGVDKHPQRLLIVDLQGAAREIMSEATLATGYLGYSNSGENVGFTHEGTQLVIKTTYSADFKTSTRAFLPYVDGAFGAALPTAEVFPEVVDARGRWYEGSYNGGIKRWDPRTGQTEVIAGPGGKAFTGTGVDDGLKGSRALRFSPAGDLFFLDTGNRQIKRIPAADL